MQKRFNVEGFPTTLVFGADKNTRIPFEGARTASAIESFALEQLETNVAPPEVTELTAAGKQPDLEKHVGVGGYGYPALVALNLKKGFYAPLKSAFELEHIREFVKEAGRGGKGNLPLGGAPALPRQKHGMEKMDRSLRRMNFPLKS
ncbi:hypothetical protein L6164_031492 [Bauhinia variegata]|uniref:Uncharacterized protein n=1 Tax=Bauhinia variegata TaxID=167791 RepID=A0ACB9LH59_BAUVA|nr:hypothetical protein L6164_031492 [Bauhinia variegata]